MAGDAGNLHGGETFLEESAGGFVTEVVEMKVHEPCTFSGAGEAAFDGLGGKAREDVLAVTKLFLEFR